MRGTAGLCIRPGTLIPHSAAIFPGTPALSSQSAQNAMPTAFTGFAGRIGRAAPVPQKPAFL